jgi:radical SAM superfamily enzyme YgiQ (UPF0313 family)
MGVLDEKPALLTFHKAAAPAPAVVKETAPAIIKEKGLSKGLRVAFVIDGEDFIEPMGPTYLAGAANAAGHTCDAMILGNTEKPLDFVRDFKPHVIAYSAVTGTHQRYFRFNQQIIEHFPDIFTIMGGAHPTNYPETIDRHPIHAVCVGEGEGAMVELLDRLAGGQKGQQLWDIQNLSFPHGPSNPKRPLISDLDTLPFPDRDIIFRNAPRMGSFPLKTFMTSRGCPFPCTYCFEPVMKAEYKGLGKYERRHSVDRVIAEILDVKTRWPVEFIKFDDDLFVLRRNDPWLEEFAERYPKEVGIPFNALVRVDSIDEWMAERLQAAGCKSLNIAIDSPNLEVRKRVILKKFTNEQVIENFWLLRRHGIGIFNNMILGLPPETPEQSWSSIQDDKDAIDLEIAAGVTFSSRSILVAYPKTEIGRWCKEKGYYEMDIDTFGESIFERSQLNCFTDEQKDIQLNILYLSGLAVWQPWLAPFIKKYAVHWRNRVAQKLFLCVYYLVKVYTLRSSIYPTLNPIRNPVQGMRDFIKGFWIEVFRTLPEMRKTVTYPAPSPRLAERQNSKS